MSESLFLTGRPEDRVAYQQAIGRAAAVLLEALPRRPYSGQSPTALADLLGGEVCPAQGESLEAVLRRMETIIRHSIVVTHPCTAAHLHCPPLIPALAAEVVLSALNQSMDSFDQAPAATVVEQQMVRWLCRQAGLPAAADGVFTAGGTQSNYTGLLLARDAFVERRRQWSIRQRGLPREARRLRILCSEMAHFTVEKSAAQLGLGTDAVVRVAVDEDFRLCPRDLEKQLNQLHRQGLFPMAIVATAGTTDFGSVDPLDQIGPQARRAGAWLHVDAAYGGALLFSGRHRHRLAGVEQADSVTLDFHKLLWQPVSCGAFLVRDAAAFEPIKLHADYLNPESDVEQGIPDLVNRSMATTRRFDALKMWTSLHVLGQQRLGRLIDATLTLARRAAGQIRRSEHLRLLHQPALGCVVFRYYPKRPGADADAVNEAIRQRLFNEGTAVIGRTRVRGQTCLKLTLLNPCTSADEIGALLDRIEVYGRAFERTIGRGRVAV
jgi:L-2,4-diaminobutyrate decarboxylase